MLAIRPATGRDAVAIQEIYATCVSGADWLPAAARAAVDFAQVSVGETVHVAVTPDGDIQGFVSVQVQQPFIHHLYVRPGARAKGVGRQLLASLRPWLPTPWQLKCVRANLQALAFYRRLGWQEVGAGAAEHGPYVVLAWRTEAVLA